MFVALQVHLFWAIHFNTDYKLKGHLPMTQQPLQSQHRMPRFNLIWLTGLIAVTLAVGIFGGRYLERSRALRPELKLQGTLEALRSGYDQGALAMLKPLADEGNPKAQIGSPTSTKTV